MGIARQSKPIILTRKQISYPLQIDLHVRDLHEIFQMGIRLNDG